MKRNIGLRMKSFDEFLNRVSGGNNAIKKSN